MLRIDSTAVLGSGSCRRTRFVRSAHCAQTAAASQFTKRAARADPEPRLAGRAGPGGPAVRQAQTVLRPVRVRAHLLVARDSAPTRYRLPLCHECGFSWDKQRRCSKGACGQAGVRLWGAEQHRACGRARSALRYLTCRRLFERSERSERSEFGDRPRDRAAQGSLRKAQTAPAKRVSLPARAFAAQKLHWQCSHQSAATGEAATPIACNRCATLSTRSSRQGAAIT